MSRPGTPTPLPRDAFDDDAFDDDAFDDDAREGGAPLNAQTEHLQKLATLGTLAAGSAHEINHLVMHLLSSLDHVSAACSALRENDDRPEDRYHDLVSAVDQSHSCARRLRALARGMTDCAQPARSQPSVTQLNSVVDDALGVVGPLLRQCARLETSLERDLPALLGNPAKLAQVVINLLINAMHAVEDNDPAEALVSVTTRRTRGALELVVTDNGCGIDPRDLSRALEPFFTTKPPGLGTGLGLAMCRHIVEEHDGDIRIASELGAGTTVTVTLPL